MSFLTLLREIDYAQGATLSQHDHGTKTVHDGVMSRATAF